MVAPISSLANMEYALYGGVGLNSAVPNYLNGYRDSINMYDSLANSYAYMNPYMYNNSAYDVNSSIYAQNGVGVNPYMASSQTPIAAVNSQPAVSESDIDKLAKFYRENLEGKEKLGGAAFGGLSFAAMENPQTLFHPMNAFNAVKPTDKIFNEAIKASPEVKKLWETEAKVMQDAYSQLFRTNRNAGSKWVTSKWFIKPMQEADRSALENIMKEALASGDKTKIMEATEKLRAANTLNGRIPSAINSVKKFFGFGKDKLPTAMESMNNAVAKGEVAKAVTERSSSFLTRGLKEGKGWFFFDLVLSSGKIISATKEGGVSSGAKQLGQSAIKSAGTAAGWVLGKAAGTAVGAKIGASIGTAVCPGLGTAIGAVVGFIGGSVGMWLMGKVTNAIAGTDEATRLEAEKMKKTPEGQAQLLSFAAQKAQEGQIDKETAMAFNNIAAQYA